MKKGRLLKIKRYIQMILVLAEVEKNIKSVVENKKYKFIKNTRLITGVLFSIDIKTFLLFNNKVVLLLVIFFTKGGFLCRLEEILIRLVESGCLLRRWKQVSTGFVLFVKEKYRVLVFVQNVGQKPGLQFKEVTGS